MRHRIRHDQPVVQLQTGLRNSDAKTPPVSYTLNRSHFYDTGKSLKSNETQSQKPRLADKLTGIDEIPQRLLKTPFSADTPPICYATDLIHFSMALGPRSVLSLSLTISVSEAVSLANSVPKQNQRRPNRSSPIHFGAPPHASAAAKMRPTRFRPWMTQGAFRHFSIPRVILVRENHCTAIYEGRKISLSDLLSGQAVFSVG